MSVTWGKFVVTCKLCRLRIKHLHGLRTHKRFIDRESQREINRQLGLARQGKQ